MDIIDQKSGVKFSPEDRQALLKKPIVSKDLTYKDVMPYFPQW